MDIRKATAADARAIRKLIWQVRINPTRLDWQRFVVAVDEHGRLLGCGQVKPHSDGTREMASIAVQPEQQGRGIGRAIVERILADHALPLYLTCRSENESFYLKFGFQTLQPTAMPPYFRQIYGAAALLSRLSPRLGKMRVMVKTA